jgi:hypothetical protein
MRNLVSIAALAALAFGAGTAQAADVVALISNDTLAWVDTDSGRVTGKTFVTGVSGRVLGIDVRPSDGKLYGLFEDGTVATIDPQTGRAARVETLKTVPAAGTHVTVDFNPVADAMRIMASDGTNLRTKIAGGAVAEDKPHAFANDDMHAAETPAIIAGAYTNSYQGTEKTALYNIDGTIAGLIRQDPPNDGTLKAVGKLGVALEPSVGFDILADGNGGNQAWLMTGANLYSVDLATGKATSVGTISDVNGRVRDIAILPAR